MEYLPNYTLGYEFDYILQPGARPLPNVTQGNTFSIGFNIPIFFWIHQREDVLSAQHSLQAARYSMSSVLSQTEAPSHNCTSLPNSPTSRRKQYKRGADSARPIKSSESSLVAYQTGKVDFLTLSSALQSAYASRITYLQNANQFFAGEVALEQAMGVPITKMMRSIKSTLVAINGAMSHGPDGSDRRCARRWVRLADAAVPAPSAAGADAPRLNRQTDSSGRRPGVDGRSNPGPRRARSAP